MYYIGTNKIDVLGYTRVMIKSYSAPTADGYGGHYWHKTVKASEVLKCKDLLTFDAYAEAETLLILDGGEFYDVVIEAKEDKDMSKKFYIKSGNGAIVRYEDDDALGWELTGIDELVYVDEIKPTDPRVVMFDTREEAQEIIDKHWIKAWNFKVIEFKENEEVEGMTFYGIQFVTGWGDTELVSVIDRENPLHTESDVAVVSVKPEELEHLVSMLPEHSHGKIVEVFMTEDGKWEIGKDWYGESVAQGYFYKLKGMSVPTYMKLADDGTVSLTTELSEATAMTNDVAMDLASKRGLKLTAFEELTLFEEIEEVD